MKMHIFKHYDCEFSQFTVLYILKILLESYYNKFCVFGLFVTTVLMQLKCVLVWLRVDLLLNS